jgi:hypothetical protein
LGFEKASGWAVNKLQKTALPLGLKNHRNRKCIKTKLPNRISVAQPSHSLREEANNYLDKLSPLMMVAAPGVNFLSFSTTTELSPFLTRDSNLAIFFLR